MADRHFRSLFRALHLRREQWTFLLMALLCVSVIVGTALWTRQAEFARVTPTPPVSGDISAAQLLQQSLDSAQTATPAPTVSPTVRSVTTPLESMTLLRPFDNTRMRQSSATGLWALHDAADYAGAEGAKVSAMADGTVISCADSGVFGCVCGNRPRRRHRALCEPVDALRDSRRRSGSRRADDWLHRAHDAGGI